MKWLIILFSVFLIGNCVSRCEEGQVNINTATLEELDLLVGIGPAYAKDIMNSRPYSSVDDLIRARNIGEARLAKIKSQGLACVDSGVQKQETIKQEVALILQDVTIEDIKEDPIVPITSNVIKPIPEENEPQQRISTPEIESIINLDSPIKNTKEKVIYESKNEKIRKYALYAFLVFALVIFAFLLLEKNGRKEDYSADDY